MHVFFYGNDLHKLFFVMVFSGPTILLMIKDRFPLQKDVVKVIKTVSGSFLQLLRDGSHPIPTPLMFYTDIRDVCIEFVFATKEEKKKLSLGYCGQLVIKGRRGSGCYFRQMGGGLYKSIAKTSYD